jgi:hypothetical protein
MKRLLRLFSPLIAFVMLFVGIEEAYPEWASEMGIDFWNAPQLDAELHEQDIRDRQLNIQKEFIHRRVNNRESIIEDLLAKRITPRSSLIQFYELNRENPKVFEYLEHSHPGKSPWEKTVVQLIGYLQVHFRDNLQEFGRWRDEIREIGEKMEEQNQ